MMPTTFSETNYLNIFNSKKRNAMVWQLTQGPGERMFSI